VFSGNAGVGSHPCSTDLVDSRAQRLFLSLPDECATSVSWPGAEMECKQITPGRQAGEVMVGPPEDTLKEHKITGTIRKISPGSK
jgi:hypothetical protein